MKSLTLNDYLKVIRPGAKLKVKSYDELIKTGFHEYKYEYNSSHGICIEPFCIPSEMMEEVLEKTFTVKKWLYSDDYDDDHLYGRMSVLESTWTFVPCMFDIQLNTSFEVE